jgi:serine protease DegQ
VTPTVHPASPILADRSMRRRRSSRSFSFKQGAAHAGRRRFVVKSALVDLSSELAGLVEALGPSVVRVEARRAPGSGVVWSEDGHVVTAHHTVEWDEGLAVGLPDGTSAPARLVGRDPSTDLALLKVEAKGLAVPRWADAGAVKVGHLALALTRPGRSVRASLGIVSVRGESWRTPTGGRLDAYLQTDIPRHPGLSGSLLALPGGDAVGVNTSGLLRAQSLVVPVVTLRRVTEALLAHGRVRRGYLGVGTYAVRLPERLARELQQPSALLIVSVEDDGPAASAGLHLGDVLVAFDGQSLQRPGDLLPLLDETRVGSTVEARVLRAGELRTLPITIAFRNRSQERGREKP